MGMIGQNPIEPYQDDESWGVVKNEGWPDLVACRPERWRFQRLADVLGAAQEIAEARLGVGEGARLIDAMREISDAKGDFSVQWTTAKRKADYEDIVDEAVAKQGEGEVLHLDWKIADDR